MKHNLLVALGFTSAVAFGASTQSVEAAEAVSVLHYWTSGGESKAIGVLKDDLNRRATRGRTSRLPAARALRP